MPTVVSTETHVASLSHTLTDVFERWFVPVWIRGQGLDSKTECLYREALSWWQRLTGNPPVSQIDDLVASAFVSRLAEQPGRRAARLSSYTVRKHCVAIGKLLDFCGPRTRSRRDRRNLGLVDMPPLVEGPRVPSEPVSANFTHREIVAMLASAHHMTCPAIDGVSPGLWWRAAITTAYYTGLRIGALLSLAWSDLDIDPVDGRYYLLSRAECAKGRKGSRVYCPPEAAKAISAIRGERRQIFAWSEARWSANWLTKLLHRLQETAGLPPERRFGWHGFRRSHATALALRGGISLAQASLGHTDEAVTRGHYVSSDAQQELLTRAVDSLPRLSGAQLSLFSG